MTLKAPAPAARALPSKFDCQHLRQDGSAVLSVDSHYPHDGCSPAVHSAISKTNMPNDATIDEVRGISPKLR